MGILAAIGKIGKKAMPRIGECRSGHISSAVDVVVSGYFGYGNSGDDTVLDCLVTSVRAGCPGARIAVLCRDPENFGREHNVIGIGRYDLPGIIRVIRSARLLISGGGSLFQNATSSRSLFYYAGVIWLAGFLGAKVFVYANGIGPLRGRICRAVARNAAMSAERISVRDPLSKASLESIGVPGERVTVTADPAFGLSLAERESTVREKRRYFAVSVRMTDRALLNELCRGCRDIYLKFGIAPVFVEMQSGEDEELCRQMAEECCGAATVIPYQCAEKLCDILGRMEFVLSMRLHLMIYAASVGTPSVGVSVDPKFDGISKVLGSAPVVRDGFSSEDVVASARRAMTTDRGELLRIARTQATVASEDVRAVLDMIRIKSF